MLNLTYVCDRINDKREQVKKLLDEIAYSFVVIVKNAGGTLSMVEKKYPENQTKTLVRNPYGVYKKMNILALRIGQDNNSLELGLAPLLETQSINDIPIHPEDGKWPVWVPLEKGPCIKAITIQEIAKNIWQFVD